MMILQKKIKQKSLSWSYIPDHLFRILIIGHSTAGKTNSLLNLIKHEDDDDM